MKCCALRGGQMCSFIRLLLILAGHFVPGRKCLIPAGGREMVPESTTSDYNITEMLSLGSSFCDDRYSCSDFSNQSFPDKLCYCDAMCVMMNDCCLNFKQDGMPNVPVTKEEVSCEIVTEIVSSRNFGVYLVNKCHLNWSDDATKSLCQNYFDADNIFLRLPVSGRRGLNIMYKNMYCAQCNYELDFDFWKPEIKCKNETDARRLPEMTGCDRFYIKPRPEVHPRICQIFPIINNDCRDPEASDDVRNNCTEHGMGIVYTDYGWTYRNKYCAFCNSVSGDLYCGDVTNVHASIRGDGTTKLPKKTYSFRVLVDFNSGKTFQNEEAFEIKTCEANEIYDIFAEVCREIFCAPPLIALDGRCQLQESNEHHINKSDEFMNCTLVKLNPEEYKITNDSTIFVFSTDTFYNITDFKVNGSDVYICKEELKTCSDSCKIQNYHFTNTVTEGYITLTGLIISIVSLAVTLVVYLSFPQLLNVPGKILVCLCVSLMLAQILFLVSSEVEQFNVLCVTVGVLVHYFFLAAFCWMNIIAFDLSITFSNKYLTTSTGQEASRRFIMYMVYAWTVPLLVVLTATVLDNVAFDSKYQSLKPNYGKGACWITSRDSLILFFAGPLALLKFFDIIAFIFTSVHIARARKEGAFASSKNRTCSFLISLKLSLIMGLTWVFAFVANASRATVMWYCFIILNSIQGLFIAVSFLCTQKIVRLCQNRYKEHTSKSASGTQQLSLS